MTTPATHPRTNVVPVSSPARVFAKRLYNAARVLVGPKLFTVPGHFYSPVVDPRQVDAISFPDMADEQPMPGAIGIDDDAMVELWRGSGDLLASLDLSAESTADHRYHYRNEYFGVGDAVSLALMLNKHRPRRVIEIGGGFSTAFMLDFADRHLPQTPAFTVVEPYPERLFSLLRPEDRTQIELIERTVQTVAPERFDVLDAGDILFVDSSHIAKTGSDVLSILFDVLPRLRPGVVVHFHDVFFPFEYISRWVVQDNRSWNEAYLLRAFLMYNDHFEIVFFNDYFWRRHRAEVDSLFPSYLDEPGGSLWLRRKGSVN